MRISDWSSDVCSSDLAVDRRAHFGAFEIQLGLVQGGQRRLVRRVLRRFDRRITAELCAYLADFVLCGIDVAGGHVECVLGRVERGFRSEEHTSELQSLMRISYAVFCLQKKKTERQTLTYK